MKIPRKGPYSPAKKSFPCLTKFGTYSLDQYCSNWRDYSNPLSYVIPPIFKFKNPDCSDEQVQILREQEPVGDQQSIIQWRCSEEAEHIVYKAIHRLSRDEIFAPFIAVHNLDLKLNPRKNGKLSGELVKLFPKFDWKNFQQKIRDAFDDQTRSGNGEFDFVLISPKFGIVLIEVKSVGDTGNKHFEANYKHGIGQLQSCCTLIYLLEECTGVKMANGARVHKILLTPNLERCKFDAWKVDKIFDDTFTAKANEVLHWCKEDINMSEETEPSLYSKLRLLFQENSTSIISSELKNWYEAHGRLLATIASSIVVRSTDQSIQDESTYISCQNFPSQNQEKKSKLLIKASESSTAFEKLQIMFLNLDQQKVMNGENRQFIIGVAGTGKTILLQAKVLELLERGDSIDVFATGSNQIGWKRLLSEYDSSKYSLSHDILEHVGLSGEKLPCNLIAFVNEALQNENYFLHLVEKIQSNPNAENVVEGEKQFTEAAAFFVDLCKRLDFTMSRATPHILIDDARCYQHENNDHVLAIILCLTKVAKAFCPNAVFWIALDPNQFRSWLYATTDDKFEVYQKTCEELNNLFVGNNRHCCIASLNRVMRCSESVYHTAYENNSCKRTKNYFSSPMTVYFGLPENSLEPIPGHKLQGVATPSIPPIICSSSEALHSIASKVLPELKRVYDDRSVDLTNFAFIATRNFAFTKLFLAIKICVALKKLFPQHDVVRLSDLDRSENAVVEKKIIVARASSVYSLEWPLVIHIYNLRDKWQGQFDSAATCHKYVARTRAISALIEVELRII